MLKTLQRAGNELASPASQLRVLADPQKIPGGAFEKQIASAGSGSLRARAVSTVQVNLGRVCNQTCSHCHVDAGPDRKEAMSAEVAAHIVDFLRHSQVSTLDITGGAPEMNPNFRWLVEQAFSLGVGTIDRCNLTILLANGFTDLPEFLAKHRTHIIASLPCYLEENCDAQRGNGVFAKSIEAIGRLNALGYGKEDHLKLDLVYNPTGLGLPPDATALEKDYRRQLLERYEIHFSNLLTITNMPISRFLDELLRQGQYTEYMHLLINAFNPQTLDSLMCRSMISIDYEGFLYDCDFNQMLDLKLAGKQHISEVTAADLVDRDIRTLNHCFGCTAGNGSSCGGSLTDS